MTVKLTHESAKILTKKLKAGVLVPEVRRTCNYLLEYIDQQQELDSKPKEEPYTPRWRAAPHETYKSVSSSGIMQSNTDMRKYEDSYHYNTGNYYSPTAPEEEILKKTRWDLARQQVEDYLRKAEAEHNVEPVDWNKTTQAKFFFEYIPSRNEFSVFSMFAHMLIPIKGLYTTSEEVAECAIKDMEKELKTLFGAEE